MSRPAVSHHMQIFKEAGIVSARKKGTYVYYHLDLAQEDIDKMIRLFTNIQKIVHCQIKD